MSGNRSNLRIVYPVATSTVDSSRITGQNAFEAISRKPDLTRVIEAFYYFSAGILMPSDQLGRA
jgi:hypothetical protein